MRPSEAMLDRLERVIETFRIIQSRWGRCFVHDEKLDKQDRIDAYYLRKLNRFIERSTVKVRRLKQDVREIFAR